MNRTGAVIMGFWCVCACTPLEEPADARLARARSMPAAMCVGAPEERAARVLPALGLIGVEPLVVTEQSSKGLSRIEVRGARLRFAAPFGVTAAWLHREIECHQADVVLGRLPLEDDDPYALPDEWLALEVHVDGGTLVVTTYARTPEAAEAAVERARRFSQRVVGR